MSELPSLGVSSDRYADTPSDEELNICLAALATGKAAGHDGAPAEIFKHLHSCKDELFAMVRQIFFG